MAEYKSFGFLMHDQPTRAQPVFVQDKPEKPATFEELYPPRDCQEIRKEEKHYWRTRHRMLYTILEDRTNACVVVRVQDTDGNKEWRPLVVDSKVLYPILDADKSKKPDSGLEDSKLVGTIADYLLARLKVSADPQKLPDFWDAEAEEPQVFLEKSFSDSWESLERPPPEGVDYDSAWIAEFQSRQQTVKGAGDEETGEQTLSEQEKNGAEVGTAGAEAAAPSAAAPAANTATPANGSNKEGKAKGGGDGGGKATKGEAAAATGAPAGSGGQGIAATRETSVKGKQKQAPTGGSRVKAEKGTRGAEGGSKGAAKKAPGAGGTPGAPGTAKAKKKGKGGLTSPLSSSAKVSPS